MLHSLFSAKPNVLWVLQVLCGLIENISDASTRTKQVFYKSIQPMIPVVESLFHSYVQHSGKYFFPFLVIIFLLFTNSNAYKYSLTHAIKYPKVHLSTSSCIQKITVFKIYFKNSSCFTTDFLFYLLLKKIK